jgi:hypothetical protein
MRSSLRVDAAILGGVTVDEVQRDRHVSVDIEHESVEGEPGATETRNGRPEGRPSDLAGEMG